MKIDDLLQFGLTENEARAYLVLLRLGPQAPGQLAPRAGVSRGRVYQVVEALVRKGFAKELPGRPVSFAAAEPRVALGTVLEDRTCEVERGRVLATTILPELEALQTDQSRAAIPGVEVLRRPSQIDERFQQLENAATREILVFVKLPRVTPGGNQGVLDALKRGVRVAGLYERAVFDDEGVALEVLQWQAAGENVRIIPELPIKMAVFDRQKAILALTTTDDPTSPATPVVVHDIGLSQTLAGAFDRLWESADAAPWDQLLSVDIHTGKGP